MEESTSSLTLLKSIQYVSLISLVGITLYFISKEVDKMDQEFKDDEKKMMKVLNGEPGNADDDDDEDNEGDDNEEEKNKQKESQRKRLKEMEVENEKAWKTLNEIAEKGLRLEDRYDKMEVLGKGGFSVVYKGKDKKTKTFVAIKEINPKRLNISQFANEVTILKNIEPHPNIIQFYALFMQDDTFYIVTEYASGGELFDRIVEHGEFSEKDARNILRTLGRTIKFLHDKGIVHRDIKPENILIANDSEDFSSPTALKLVDFGFAKDVTNDPNHGIESKMGTPLYMAPEILRGEFYGTAVDCWAFGVIMFILLTGHPPFPQGNIESTFRAILKGPDFKPEVWNAKSPQARSLLERILVSEPSDRPSMREILSDPWFKNKSLSSVSMNHLPELRKFVVRRHLRSAITAVMAMNRVRALNRKESSDSNTST